MKKRIQFSILFLSILTITSCEKFDFETGVTGTIKYGEGDCFPPHDAEEESEKYNGQVYFIAESEIDSITLPLEAINELKLASFSTTASKGKIKTAIPEGRYLLMVEKTNVIDEDYYITISEGNILTIKYIFFNCLTQ